MTSMIMMKNTRMCQKLLKVTVLLILLSKLQELRASESNTYLRSSSSWARLPRQKEKNPSSVYLNVTDLVDFKGSSGIQLDGLRSSNKLIKQMGENFPYSLSKVVSLHQNNLESFVQIDSSNTSSSKLFENHQIKQHEISEENNSDRQHQQSNYRKILNDRNNQETLFSNPFEDIAQKEIRIEAQNNIFKKKDLEESGESDSQRDFVSARAARQYQSRHSTDLLPDRYQIDNNDYIQRPGTISRKSNGYIDEIYSNEALPPYKTNTTRFHTRLFPGRSESNSSKTYDASTANLEKPAILHRISEGHSNSFGSKEFALETMWNLKSTPVFGVTSPSPVEPPDDVPLQMIRLRNTSNEGLKSDSMDHHPQKHNEEENFDSSTLSQEGGSYFNSNEKLPSRIPSKSNLGFSERIGVNLKYSGNSREHFNQANPFAITNQFVPGWQHVPADPSLRQSSMATPPRGTMMVKPYMNLPVTTLPNTLIVPQNSASAKATTSPIMRVVPKPHFPFVRENSEGFIGEESRFSPNRVHALTPKPKFNSNLPLSSSQMANNLPFNPILSNIRDAIPADVRDMVPANIRNAMPSNLQVALSTDNLALPTFTFQERQPSIPIPQKPVSEAEDFKSNRLFTDIFPTLPSAGTPAPKGMLAQTLRMVMSTMPNFDTAVTAMAFLAFLVFVGALIANAVANGTNLFGRNEFLPLDNALPSEKFPLLDFLVPLANLSLLDTEGHYDHSWPSGIENLVQHMKKEGKETLSSNKIYKRRQYIGGKEPSNRVEELPDAGDGEDGGLFNRLEDGIDMAFNIFEDIRQLTQTAMLQLYSNLMAWVDPDFSRQEADYGASENECNRKRDACLAHQRAAALRPADRSLQMLPFWTFGIGWLIGSLPARSLLEDLYAKTVGLQGRCDEVFSRCDSIEINDISTSSESSSLDEVTSSNVIAPSNYISLSGTTDASHFIRVTSSTSRSMPLVTQADIETSTQTEQTTSTTTVSSTTIDKSFHFEVEETNYTPDLSLTSQSTSSVDEDMMRWYYIGGDKGQWIQRDPVASDEDLFQSRTEDQHPIKSRTPADYNILQSRMGELLDGPDYYPSYGEDPLTLEDIDKLSSFSVFVEPESLLDLIVGGGVMEEDYIVRNERGRKEVQLTTPKQTDDVLHKDNIKQLVNYLLHDPSLSV